MLFILFLCSFWMELHEGKLSFLLCRKRGAAFFSKKMQVPPSGPNKQHNYVPRLRSFHSSKSSIWFKAPCSIRRESPKFFYFERKYTSIGGLRRRNTIARLKGEDAELPFWLSSARKLDSDWVWMIDLAFSIDLLATLKEHREWSGPFEYIRDC